MTDEQITTIGRCYVCKRTFGFLPASVTTVVIDPETGLPPGMTVLGTYREPVPEAAARSVAEPICADCVNKAERYRDSMHPSALQFDTWPGNPERG